MKLIKHKPKTPDFLKHTPNLVSAFLSPLVHSKEELDDVMNPVIKEIDPSHFNSLITSKIMICGDFDCDGILSTTLLVRALKRRNLEVGYYIPNRLSEGYGTKLETVIAAHQKGYDTIILLDNGVINSDVHTYCKENGLTLIVIDHHQIPEPVNCDLLIHPDVLDHHFAGMCSAGLVYSLFLNESDDYDCVLSAIATIGDVMDLRHQNRGIVKQGIEYLNTRYYETLSSLLNRLPSKFDVSVIAFQIVPVFNALGRLADLGNVNTIVQYLLSSDSKVIASFSAQLKNINQQRKNLSAHQSRMALNILNESDAFQILYHPQFHPGLVGITAGQIASNTQKPAMVLSGESILKGSVRANGFNVYEFLKQFESRYFKTFGGHASACALSIDTSDLTEFKENVQKAMETVIIEEPTIEVLLVEPSDLNKEDFLALEAYEPFGQGFKPYPIYLEVMLIGLRPLGQTGFAMSILPIGEIQEILYFKKDIVLENVNQRLGVVGSLQINNRGSLSMIADAVFVI